MSEDVAGYWGAVDAMTEAIKHKGEIIVRGDNEQVIMQLGRDPAISEVRRRKWGMAHCYYPAIELADKYRGRLRFECIPPEQNVVCKELCSKVLSGYGIRPKRHARKTSKGKPARSKSRRWRKRKGAADFNKKGGQ